MAYAPDLCPGKCSNPKIDRVEKLLQKEFSMNWFVCLSCAFLSNISKKLLGVIRFQNISVAKRMIEYD